MPYPKKGEKKEDYISRCMGSDESQKTFPDQKQRAAFCYSNWKKHSKAQHDIGNAMWGKKDKVEDEENNDQETVEE